MARRSFRLTTRSKRVHGAALTEALIAAVMLTILFAAVLFFHDLHDHKGDTLRLARYQAWTATRPGCHGTVQGQHEKTVKVPVVMQQAGSRLTELNVKSGLEMSCNEKPEPNDDLLAVLAWATSTTEDALASGAVDAVAHFFHF